MLRLSRSVLRHKAAVVLFWLAVLVAGGAASSRVPDRLGQDFSFPGQPGYEANVAILKTYGNGGPANPLVPVVTLPAGWVRWWCSRSCSAPCWRSCRWSWRSSPSWARSW